MTKITITVDGEEKEFDSFYDAVRHLAEHESMPEPACPKCGKTNWKTWDGSAYCRGCGNLISTNRFYGMMGFDPI